MGWVVVSIGVFLVTSLVAVGGMVFLRAQGSITTTIVLVGLTITMGGLGLVMTPFSAWYVVQGVRSDGWSPVSGEISESRIEVIRHRTSTRGTYGTRRTGTREELVPVIRYHYVADGRQYTGDELAFSSDQGYAGFGYATTRSRIETMVAEHRVGAPVTVYVDPGSPLSSVLEPGVQTSEAGKLGFGLAALLAAALSGVALLTSENVRRLLRD